MAEGVRMEAVRAKTQGENRPEAWFMTAIPVGARPSKGVPQSAYSSCSSWGCSDIVIVIVIVIDIDIDSRAAALVPSRSPASKSQRRPSEVTQFSQ
jgi:hypothetical protein